MLEIINKSFYSQVILLNKTSKFEKKIVDSIVFSEDELDDEVIINSYLSYDENDYEKENVNEKKLTLGEELNEYSDYLNKTYNNDYTTNIIKSI